jgi:hypothetical protein
MVGYVLTPVEMDIEAIMRSASTKLIQPLTTDPSSLCVNIVKTAKLSNRDFATSLVAQEQRVLALFAGVKHPMVMRPVALDLPKVSLSVVQL